MARRHRKKPPPRRRSAGTHNARTAKAPEWSGGATHQSPWIRAAQIAERRRQQQAALGDTNRELRAVCTELHNTGAILRQIGNLIGVSAQAVHSYWLTPTPTEPRRSTSAHRTVTEKPAAAFICGCRPKVPAGSETVYPPPRTDPTTPPRSRHRQHQRAPQCQGSHQSGVSLSSIRGWNQTRW